MDFFAPGRLCADQAVLPPSPDLQRGLLMGTVALLIGDCPRAPSNRFRNLSPWQQCTALRVPDTLFDIT